MRWPLKAASQKALGSLPRGDALNYVLQRRIRRTLPVDDAGFRRKFDRAVVHFGVFCERAPRKPDEATFYEFGAGWDLIIPLAYFALGVERQVLVDIRSNVRFELVNDSLTRFATLARELEQAASRPLRPLGPPTVTRAADLEERFGIAYLAPRDTRNTGLARESIDFVSSTNTLEHVPEGDIEPILRECGRLLRRDGAISCRIDLRDHYSYVDRTISPYNFLRFSERAWALANSSLHYQNRLRYPDYVRLFEAAGLEIIAEAVSRPGPVELALLRELKIAPRFSNRYSLEDLGAKSVAFVARGRPPAAPR